MKRVLRFLVPVLLLSAAFLAGVYVGKQAPHHRGGLRTDIPEFRAKMLKRLTRELELNAEQRKAVRSILQLNGSQLKEIRQGIRTQVKGIHEQTYLEISAVLTAEQQLRFKKMKERMKARRKKHREKRRRKTKAKGLRGAKGPGQPQPEV